MFMVIPRERKMVSGPAVYDGMLRLSFLLEACQPGTVPDASLIAAVLDLVHSLLHSFIRNRNFWIYYLFDRRLDVLASIARDCTGCLSLRVRPFCASLQSRPMAVLDEVESSLLSAVGTALKSRDAIRTTTNAHTPATGGSHVLLVGRGQSLKPSSPKGLSTRLFHFI